MRPAAPAGVAVSAKLQYSCALQDGDRSDAVYQVPACNTLSKILKCPAVYTSFPSHNQHILQQLPGPIPQMPLLHGLSSSILRDIPQRVLWSRPLESSAASQPIMIVIRIRSAISLKAPWSESSSHRGTLQSIRRACCLQVGLACKAKQQPDVRKGYRHHVLAGATGLACFGLEDIAIQRDFHFVHSMWHCLAFYSLAKASTVLT